MKRVPARPTLTLAGMTFYEKFTLIAGLEPAAPRWPVRWRTRCACLDDYELVRAEFLASCPTWPGKRPIWAEQARAYRATYGGEALEKAGYVDIRRGEAR